MTILTDQASNEKMSEHIYCTMNRKTKCSQRRIRADVDRVGSSVDVQDHTARQDRTNMRTLG